MIRWPLSPTFAAALALAIGACGDFALAEDTPLQKPVIPDVRIAALHARLREHGWPNKPFDTIADAVIATGSPHLAFRLLVEAPDLISFEHAANEGNATRLRLLHLAEHAGYGSLVDEAPEDVVSRLLGGDRNEIVLLIAELWNVPDETLFFEAACAGNVEVADSVLVRILGDSDHPINDDHWLFDGLEWALWDAVDAGRYDILQRVLAAGIAVDTVGLVLTTYAIDEVSAAVDSGRAMLRNFVTANRPERSTQTITLKEAVSATGADPLAKPIPWSESTPFAVACRDPVMLAIIIESCPSIALPIRDHRDAPEWWLEDNPQPRELFRFYGGTPLPRTNRWFLDAIARQDHPRVQYFLDHHYDVNESYDGVLPIEEAARACDPELVDLLLKHGASVTNLPDGGHSILASAVLATGTNERIRKVDGWFRCSIEQPRSCDMTILERVLKEGVDPSAISSRGKSGLDVAIEYGRAEAAAKLLERGARHTIHTAAALRAAEELASIVARDPDRVHARSYDGRLPIEVAVAAGSLPCVRVLLAHGAVLESPEACLASAVRSGSTDLVAFLVQEWPGEPIGEATITGLLDAVMATPPRADMVRLLISHGADASAKPHLLAMAAEHGNLEVVEILVDAGAPINGSCGVCWGEQKTATPLSAAICSSLEFVDPLMDAIVRRNRRAVARLLVEEGADPREESSVVIDAVARLGDMALAKRLLAIGGGPGGQWKNRTGSPLLLQAISLRDQIKSRDPKVHAALLRLIDLLLLHDINHTWLNWRDDRGNSIQDWVLYSKDETVAQRLEEAIRLKERGDRNLSRCRDGRDGLTRPPDASGVVIGA